MNRVLCRVVSVAYELEPGQTHADDGSGDEQSFRVRMMTDDAGDNERADVSIVLGRDELVAYPLGGRVYVTVEPKDRANPIEKEAARFRFLRAAAEKREDGRVSAAYKAWSEAHPRGQEAIPSSKNLIELLREPENETLLLSAFHLAEEYAGGRPIG